MTNQPSPTPQSSSLRLIIAWSVVGIPLLWGVAQVVVKSLALFK